MSAIELIDLEKKYGTVEAVRGVNLVVQPGELVGLIGPNGAGKTTSFHMIVGLISPDAGRVIFNDEDITSDPMYQRARLGISYLPQEPSVFRKLTVEENILAILQTLTLSRQDRQERLDSLIEEMGLETVRHSLGYQISGGERRRLEIARLLVATPKIILLDEPFTGIDPVTIDSIQEIIRDLREQGISILITDHQVRETLAITDRSYVIRDGKVLCHGTPSEIIRHPEAREHYFGEGIEIAMRGDRTNDAGSFLTIQKSSRRQPRLRLEADGGHHTRLGITIALIGRRR